MVLSAEKEHCLRITNQVHNFFTQQSLCDLSIFVQEKEFRLHRIIFAAVCPSLYNLITKATQGEPFGYLTLKLHGLTSSDFQLLLDYIYTGKIPSEAQSSLRAEFVKVCCVFQISIPCKKLDQTVWLTPKDDVQVAILPRNELGIIEVVLQKFGDDLVTSDKISSPVDLPNCPEISDGEHEDPATPVDKKIKQIENKNTDADLSETLSDHHASDVGDFEDDNPSSSVLDDSWEILLTRPTDANTQAPCDNVTSDETVPCGGVSNDGHKFSQVFKVHSKTDTSHAKSLIMNNPLPITPGSPSYLSAAKTEKSSRYKSNKRKLANEILQYPHSSKYECPFCLRKYRRHHPFQEHIAKCKMSIKYKCSLCPRRFRSKNITQIHIREAHQGNENFRTR